MSVDEMKKMKKLMENFAAADMAGEEMPPMDDMDMGAPEMDGGMDDMGADMASMPTNDMGINAGMGMDYDDAGGDASVIEELDAEFKRITAEYLQADGPLDAPEHSDMRKKLTDSMEKMLDALHDGWKDDMMGDEGAHDASGDKPEFFGGTDDDDDDGADDSEDTASDDDDSEADDDDSETETDADDDDSDDSDDSDDDDSDDSDDGDDDSGNNPFQFNESKSSAENMRKLMESIK